MIFRGTAGQGIGFMAMPDIGHASDADRAADPAVAPALAMVQRYGGVRPGGANWQRFVWRVDRPVAYLARNRC